jgi:cell division septal protein FtsQ
MAVTLDRTGRPAKGRVLDRSLAFQRGERKAALQKSRRRLVVRRVHILALTVVLGGLFFVGARAYLFFVSWDRLTIRKVELGCAREGLRRDIEGFFRTRPLGNMLLCDIGRLQRQLEGFSWVRDVRVQKVFPETLRVEVEERAPFALLECGGTFVVDADGVKLEAVGPGTVWPLPLVKDENRFRRRFLEKWRTARECLESLSADQRNSLASLECSDDGRVTLRFREGRARVIVDGTDAGAKLAFFEANRAGWEGRFGRLESVDLRLDGRVVVRPFDPEEQGPPPNSPKEAD